MYSDAQEPYIDLGNYRISLFFFDEKYTCPVSPDGCDSGWEIVPAIVEGVDKTVLKITHQKLAVNETARGKWNQRLVIQFGDPAGPGKKEQLTAITRQLQTYLGIKNLIHRGATSPLRLVFRLNANSFSPVKWDDDLSWNDNAVGTDNSPGYPITPDFTDPAPDNPGVPVDRLNPKHCETADTTVDKILVEEWDGYVWRRVFGNAPQIAVGAVAPTRQPVDVNQMSIVSVASGTLRFTLPRSGPVRLQVLDMKGRVAAVPVDGERMAGTHTVKWASLRLGRGVYMARLTAGNEVRIVRGVNVR